MGSYYTEDSRCYSGYDEYAGIFGPLQATSSSAFRSRGRLPPHHRGFSNSRNLESSSKLRKDRRSVTREFNDRAKFLANRKVKRVLKPLEGDSADAEDLENKENEPTSPTHGLQRQLETENGQHEADIASLKREIRQKQRTMATLELMLLNVSASSRINNSAEENAAREANNLVDELLANQADSAATEEGSITNAVSCVLCGKRFVSAEYLLRHQQRRHQDTKKNKKKKSLSGSSSDTDSKKKKKRKKSEKPAPLPTEILDALEEKNQLAKQLVALQDQKKQEDTKHDLLRYTQEAISRLQMEAANAELVRIQAQKNSRAGKLENDDEEAAKFDAKWSEKVEKMMDTFLRAQAQKQQEIDALEQESNLATLDAERFGVDRGEVVETETKPVARLEDKRIQTDDEDEGKHFKRESKPETLCEAVQTEAEPKVAPVTAVVVPPVRIEAIKRFISPPPVEQPPAPTPEKETLVIPPVHEEKESKPVDPRAKLQQAAHVIGKVALGFLTRRALAKSSNWRITIDLSSLEAGLTAPELEYVRQHYDSRLHVQVEEAMTANDLRVMIAKILSGKDEFEAEHEAVGEITASMTYHRVLLHHKQTGAELSGDMLIYELKNNVEVEIIPYHEVAAMQVGEKRLSGSPCAATIFVRGFLAKKNVELMKIDRLMDARLVRMRNTASTDEKPLEASWMGLDPVLAAEYEKAQRRLEQVLRVKLHREDASEDDLRLLSQAEYEQHSANLSSELPSDVQHRIQLVTERLPPMATGEYRRRQADTKQGIKHRTAGAAKMHRAVQVEVLANAYEEGNSPIEVLRPEDKVYVPPAVEIKEDTQEEEKLQIPLQLTPRMGRMTLIQQVKRTYWSPGYANYSCCTSWSLT
ncbi:Zinc finger, C2H2 [Phytophthora cactorum]|nr:Zinc finger, C2H2 [Phytophthora cactorum]